jgi:transglutaminase-like putative cysteine protease
MLLQITHETQLGYSAPVSESVMELRMAPRQEQDQRRLSFHLAIGPAASVTRYFDWLGNMVHTFNITPSHDAIRIVASSVVETLSEVPDPAKLNDWWPIGVDDIDYELYDFVQFGGPIIDCPELRELAQSLGARSGMFLSELAMAIMEKIRTDFVYERGATSSASPITEVLHKRRGVCQDFTHLMIGLARALRIPARYVSGCLHPVGGSTVGYTETHAWCELYFPSIGWIGFDPANGCLAGPNFVRLAVGRSFADVPPNKGVFRGRAGETISVKVHSTELAEVPSDLAPERFDVLPLKVREVPRIRTNQQIAQQQEQQQQHKDLNQQQQQQQQ